MAKCGRPRLGKEIVRFTITTTLSERDMLQSIADSEGISLARCIVSRALSATLPEEISVADLELMLQIANRCDGKIQTSVLRIVLNS